MRRERAREREAMRRNSFSSRRSRRRFYRRSTETMIPQSLRPRVTEIDGGLIQSPSCSCCGDRVYINPDGFDIEDETTEYFTGNTNVNMCEIFKKTTTCLARQALKTYQDYYGVPYEFVSVQKAAMNTAFEYYITFTAKQTDDGDVVKTKTMQAMVEKSIGHPFVFYVRIIPST